MAAQTLTITDNRTGKQYTIPIENDSIPAASLWQIAASADDPGLVVYDPGSRYTALCKSKITFVDPERGILRYRGYAVEELAAKSTYLETAYLIVKGELPDAVHLAMWRQNITVHTMVHENIKVFMDGYRYDAHPMGLLVGTVGALSTFYPDAMAVTDLESRRLQTRRLIGKLPTLAAFAYRRSRGLPYVYPDNELSYTGNFLSMLFRMTELQYVANPVLERALEVLFITHADHEQNCATTAVRTVASSYVDPYSAAAAGVAALYGPRHGGADEQIVEMLRGIGTVDRVAAFVKDAKATGKVPLGFESPLYANGDPRAKVLRDLAGEVFEVTGRDVLVDVALELERIALQDDYFGSHKWLPNAEFYSSICYLAMGFPTTMFPVLLAIPRTAGWMAHWAELVRDPEQVVARPTQIYLGEGPRSYVPIDQRAEPSMREDAVSERI